MFQRTFGKVDEQRALRAVGRNIFLHEKARHSPGLQPVHNRLLYHSCLGTAAITYGTFAVKAVREHNQKLTSSPFPPH